MGTIISTYHSAPLLPCFQNHLELLEPSIGGSGLSLSDLSPFTGLVLTCSRTAKLPHQQILQAGLDCLIMLMKKLELQKYPVDGFSAGLVDDDNILEWQIVIMG